MRFEPLVAVGTAPLLRQKCVLQAVAGEQLGPHVINSNGCAIGPDCQKHDFIYNGLHLDALSDALTFVQPNRMGVRQRREGKCAHVALF